MTADLEKLLAEATPGPWGIVKRGEDAEIGSGGWNSVDGAFDDYQIATAWGGYNNSANARLIAMAPDLARQVIALTAENAALRARAEKLAKAAEECAGDVEAFVNEAYCAPEIHPEMRAKYDRDMEIVSRTREAIAVFRAKETP